MTFLQQEQQADKLIWTIARPERLNALGESLGKELHMACGKLKKTFGKSQIPKTFPTRALIIKAELKTTDDPPTWIAGGDLKELAKFKGSSPVRSYIKKLSDLCFSLESLPIPVVAVIDGAAIGGGAEFVLAADIRIGNQNASFVFKQLDIGLATGYGGGKRLVDLLGRAKSQQLLYSGLKVRAQEAYQLGLLTHLSSDLETKTLLAQVLKWIDHIDPRSFAAQKIMLRCATNAEQQKFIGKENSLFLPLWGNPTHKKFLTRWQ